MSFKKLVILSALLIIPGFVSASVIKFDSVTDIIFGSVTDSDCTFCLNGDVTPHFGDAAQPDGILDWHNGGSNASNAIVI
ncbi:MAG: hypothetical protein ACX936_04850 [Marinobacter sp.]